MVSVWIIRPKYLERIDDGGAGVGRRDNVTEEEDEKSGDGEKCRCDERQVNVDPAWCVRTQHDAHRVLVENPREPDAKEGLDQTDRHDSEAIPMTGLVEPINQF